MKNKDFKFRIFTGKNALCGDNGCPCNSPFIYGDEAKARLSEFEGETQIELFTGYKDKNGKEIYEGDILCFTQNTGMPQEFDTFCVVKNSKMYLRPVPLSSLPKHNITELPNPIVYERSEIIGNIHEDKEQLGE